MYSLSVSNLPNHLSIYPSTHLTSYLAKYQSRSQDLNSFSASQRTPYIVWFPVVNCAQQSPPLVDILSEMNPVL
jgi:hypothetical protein